MLPVAIYTSFRLTATPCATAAHATASNFANANATAHAAAAVVSTYSSYTRVTLHSNSPSADLSYPPLPTFPAALKKPLTPMWAAAVSSPPLAGFSARAATSPPTLT
mmetsp:Transcript_36307/g.83182  ORF Transcript_36307/g.83182 Transcript_36307/m.83182 type:complete len:107 (+) Transcript_36307:152-472(+)